MIFIDFIGSDEFSIGGFGCVVEHLRVMGRI